MMTHKRDALNNSGQILPDGWEKAYDEATSRFFYVDHNNKTTTWINPNDQITKPRNIDDCRADQLPYGWERLDDPLVGTYYTCHLNGRNQWTNPVTDWLRSSPHHYSNSHHPLSNGQASGNSLDSNNQTNSLTSTSKPDTSYVTSDIEKSATSLNNSTTLDTELVGSIRSHNSTKGSKYDASFLNIMDSCFLGDSGQSVEV